MATTTLRQPIPPKRILVVEDEALVAHTVRMALAVDGHKVDVAETGEQGFEKFKEERQDVVITDFKLARMDGLEMAAAVKGISPGTPIILVTAHADAIKSGMGKVSNIDLLLSKPFSIGQLQDALRKLFPQS